MGRQDEIDVVDQDEEREGEPQDTGFAILHVLDQGGLGLPWTPLDEVELPSWEERGEMMAAMGVVEGVVEPGSPRSQ